MIFWEILRISDICRSVVYSVTNSGAPCDEQWCTRWWHGDGLSSEPRWWHGVRHSSEPGGGTRVDCSVSGGGTGVDCSVSGGVTRTVNTWYHTGPHRTHYPVHYYHPSPPCWESVPPCRVSECLSVVHQAPFGTKDTSANTFISTPPKINKKTLK